MSPVITAVSRKAAHGLGKGAQLSIRLLAGHGVEGDAHAGKTVRHRAHIAADPSGPNLRQVHLIHEELHEELGARGFKVVAGQMGENVTTRGVDLLSLPAGARLKLGVEAVVELTGLRSPCLQLEALHRGLAQAVIGRDSQGRMRRKAGVMAVVVRGGDVLPGDGISVELPPEPHLPLEPV